MISVAVSDQPLSWHRPLAESRDLCINPEHRGPWTGQKVLLVQQDQDRSTCEGLSWVETTWLDHSRVILTTQFKKVKVIYLSLLPSVSFSTSRHVFCDVVVMETTLRRNMWAAVQLCWVCCCWHLVVVSDVWWLKLNQSDRQQNFDLKNFSEKPTTQSKTQNNI